MRLFIVTVLAALAILFGGPVGPGPQAPPATPPVTEPRSTSPFAYMPYGTRIDCYFDDTNYFNCYINAELTYRLSWNALTKDNVKSVFRWWATPDRQLVTDKINFVPGQQEYFYVVSPGDGLPGR